MKQTPIITVVIAGLDSPSRVYPTWVDMPDETRAGPSFGAIHHFRKKMDARVVSASYARLQRSMPAHDDGGQWPQD